MLGLSLRTHHVRDLFKSLLAEKQFTSINREASMTNLVGFEPCWRATDRNSD